MLTADLVRAREKDGKLLVSTLAPRTQKRALELAEELLSCAKASIGAPRAYFDSLCQRVTAAARERKLALGLAKLIEDRCSFESPDELDPVALRAELFTLAAEARRSASDDTTFDRDAFFHAQAQARGLSVEDLERALFLDLRDAQLLLSFDAVDAATLVSSYDLAQQQAVLLRAVDVVAHVRCRDAYAYRALFRKLKFLRLLHFIERHADGGYRIAIDGPFSVFSASTKYGLSLAMALPALRECEQWSLRANVRWGKERTPLVFELDGSAPSRARELEPALPDDVAQFLSKFRALESAWQASASSDVLEVRGSGLCVPDVRFEHRQTGEVAYLEALGFWSREAVFRRVELSRDGLEARVIFAASSRLRVSEALLDPAEAPSELYVYKGAILAREVLTRLDRVPAQEVRSSV